MFTQEGYLEDIDAWNEKLMHKIANDNQIELTAEKIVIIKFFREFYLKNTTIPKMRVLQSHLKEKKLEHLNSIELNKLFNEQLNLKAAKLAGLPKPVNCI